MTAWGDRLVFVDTNILYYAIDADAGDKHERAMEVVEQIWSGNSGVISTQVLSEWTVNLRKKKKLDWRDVARIIEPYLVWQVVAIEPNDPLEAIRIASRHQVSYWDSLIIRAAQKGAADVVLSEDFNPGQVIEGIELVNPL